MKLLTYIGENTDELTYGKKYAPITHTNGAVIIENDIDEIKLYMDDLFAVIPEVRQEVTKFIPPKFELGGIYDLRYLNDGLPNRIRILGYAMSINSDAYSHQWIYQVEMENLVSKKIRLTEAFIEKRISKMTAPVYELDVIKTRINNGMRWVGNYSIETAQSKVNNLLTRDLVDCAYIREAYNRNGEFIPYKASLWIKHKYPIYE